MKNTHNFRIKGDKGRARVEMVEEPGGWKATVTGGEETKEFTGKDWRQVEKQAATFARKLAGNRV